MLVKFVIICKFYVCLAAILESLNNNMASCPPTCKGLSDVVVHEKHISRLCRICTGIITERDVFYDVKSHTKRLADTFNIDVGTDANHGHPNRFCAKCFAATGHQKTRGSTPSFSAVTWSPHSTACSICVEMATRSKGGRPPKAKKRKGGRPSSVVNIDNIMELDPSKPLSDKHEQALVLC